MAMNDHEQKLADSSRDLAANVLRILAGLTAEVHQFEGQLKAVSAAIDDVQQHGELAPTTVIRRALDPYPIGYKGFPGEAQIRNGILRIVAGKLLRSAGAMANGRKLLRAGFQAPAETRRVRRTDSYRAGIDDTTARLRLVVDPDRVSKLRALVRDPTAARRIHAATIRSFIQSGFVRRDEQGRVLVTEKGLQALAHIENAGKK